MTLLQIIHMVAALPVLAEALNKLERVDPIAAGLTGKARTLEILKASAWGTLAMSAAGALVTPLLLQAGVPVGSYPFLHVQPSTFSETLAMVGVAALIVRTRIKEG
jgi:hypothetical protein